MASTIMNHYTFSSNEKALGFDAGATDLASFFDQNLFNDPELIDPFETSPPLFPLVGNSTTPSFSNAFAQQDALLASPLGLSPSQSLSPYDFAYDFTTSPMLSSSYDGSGTIEGLATPELGGNDLALPSLFFPSNSNDLVGMESPVWNPMDLGLISTSFLDAPVGAISPQMMRLDSFEASPSPLIAEKKVVASRKRKESSPLAFEIDASEQVVVAPQPASFAKDKFNGTRNTKIKPIPFDAPTMTRSYIIPSITSRKRAPAAISAKLLPSLTNKRQKRSESPQTPAPAFDSINDEGCLDPSELPDELLSAIELKRRQNTLAARRSRMRKKDHLEGIQKGVEGVQAELEIWKARALKAEEELKAIRGS